MENLLPWTQPTTVEETETPLARTWAWDPDRLEFKLNDGRMYEVTGNAAIRIWIWKLFKTQRWHEVVHTWAYGCELYDLIGDAYSKAFVNAESQRMVREAIMTNMGDYVTDIKNLTIYYKNRVLHINFTLDTIYQAGEVFDIGV